jgi:hypothetical protein
MASASATKREPSSFASILAGGQSINVPVAVLGLNALELDKRVY